MNPRNIAGNIMQYLEAFEGSRAAIDTPQILIVRGMSRKKIDAEKIDLTISEVLRGLGAKEIDPLSKEAGNIIGVMDEQIRAHVQIQEDTDVYGIYRLKESFESMNCHADYGMGLVGNVAIFMVLWKDKSGIGPLFVELVISNLEA